MAFSNNKMLCLHVLVAFLGIGDCSLTPILRPLLSLLDAPVSTSVNNGNPSRSSYRIHGSLPPVSMSSGRWGGAKMDAPVIIPQVTSRDGDISSKAPLPGVIRTRLITPQMDEWAATNPEVSVKYLNRMGKLDGDKLGWTYRTGNDVPKVTVNPLKKGYTDTKKGWMIDGSGEGDWVKKPIIVKPLKDGYRRMMLYSGTGDVGLRRDGSNEAGSNEQSWKTSRWINRSGEDPGHDSDDQADRDRHGVKTYWRSANIPTDSNEDMERIVIIEKPILSRTHTHYHSKDASRKHLRRGYKLARNGESACPYCSDALV
ncbi:uncharacterized protein LOC133524874 [Cydia pomonella]|uniref:uncharacterized protein LOC133524874 n=1 Tax=Cydia pomonella TaxID=82600 RepID=UPI002ADE6EB1|nr:uncharacterized protein LOC133524874 [Cydia pomonella]